MADIRDILEIGEVSTEHSRDSVMGNPEKHRKRPIAVAKRQKKPEGMSREVFSLLLNDSKDAPPLFPVEAPKGYKERKANLGMKKVRHWKWAPFENPARTDGAIFHHWTREGEEGKEYTFARFNKKVDIPSYTDAEYIPSDGWTKEETDHLFDLCRRFDLRFAIVCDRWDRTTYSARDIETLKERYYGFVGALTKTRDENTKVYVFDADHERRRKEQLRKLFDRTQEQLDEEQMLVNELRKLETRKKEREKKTQDLQKLITAADGQVELKTTGEKKLPKKKVQPIRPVKVDTTIIEGTGIKFPDCKGHGTSLRSHRMKLPVNVGQKKAKAIEGLLNELGLEANPMPTDEISQHFNELRSDMVLLYELRTAMASCDYELQALRLQYENLCPGKTLEIPELITQPIKELDSLKGKAPSVDDIVDVVGSPGTPAIN